MHARGHVLSTQRTVLVPFDDDDAAELLVMYRDPKVRAYLLDNVLVTPSWVQHQIDDSQRRFARYGAGQWAVRRTGEPDIIGFAGLREVSSPPQLQLLYGFLPSSWGQGYAGEVTARVCERVFRDLELEEITATTDEPNGASSRVLERLGMQLVRTTKDNAGGMRMYALSRDRWLDANGEHEA